MDSNTVGDAPLRTRLQLPAAVLAAVKVVKTIAMAVVGPVIVISYFHWVTTESWWARLVATGMYAALMWKGIHLLRHPDSQTSQLHQGVANFTLTTFIAVAVAASVSYELQRFGWAAYAAESVSDFGYMAYVQYYTWVLLAMIPGLEAPELLFFTPPMQPANTVAGLPVLAFRVLVLAGLFGALKTWWGRRQLHPGVGSG